MSFHLQEIPPSILSEKSNDIISLKFCHVLPSEELLSELPLSKNLEFKPIHAPIMKFTSFLEEILDFDVHSSDVFVCSIPKCGSSWMQTIAWLLTHGLQYKELESIGRWEKMGNFDEVAKIVAAKGKAKGILEKDASNSLDQQTANKLAWHEVFGTLDAPRIIETHNPVYYLPKKNWQSGAKVIYIVRNPKDMIVSFYHYVKNQFRTNFSMDECVNEMINDRWFGSPNLNHIRNYWSLRHLPNVLIVAYEDLVMNAFATIKKISEFLGCKYTDDQLAELTDYISFDKMKKNKAINREADIIRMENAFGSKRPDSEFKFLRKGKVGGYRDELNEEQIQKIDKWTESGLKDTDFQFKL